MSTVALKNHLKPLAPFLDEEGVTEICINKPHEVYVEKNRQFTRHELPELCLSHLETLAELVAEFNHQHITQEKPLLTASLLNGERVQFVRAPACEKNTLICAIRRHERQEMTLDDYEIAGAFDDLQQPTTDLTSTDRSLLSLYHQRDFLAFIRLAIRARKNIIISGGTSTGKTTFLNACLKLTQPNSVHLLAAKGEQGTAKIEMRDLFECCLRLRPDRIFLSELRGKEAFPFLRAANSGHPGSLTTVHADTPQACMEQMLFMMQQAGSTSSDERLLHYIRSIIPIIIQLKRSPHPDRFMTISEIYYDKAHHSV